jgi:glycosyltransferase involved in cell wall biosynthesis
MKVSFFQRKPFQDFVSIEHIYDMVRANLPDGVEVETYISKYHSKGVVRRVYSIFEAALRQGEVNHVTGDVNFLVFLLNRKNTILSVHGTFNPNPSKIVQRLLELFWWRLPLKKVKYVTVVSNTLKKELINRFNCDKNKIKVIYNPLNPVFQPLEKPFSAKPIILQVGTKVVKNLERLITALEGINCHLHIIGMLSDGQKKRLERYQIEFTNEVSLSTFEMKRAYENCDIVSFVSLYEGFGMPIMEANAIGRVVITGNRTSIPEVAKNAALLINPLNMEAIRNGILKLINDDNYRNQLIQNGFENVKRFDVKMITKQYLELYEEVYENR